MLILERKKEQKIKLTTPSGEVVTITVVKSSPNKVRLGFEAPESVKIEKG